MNNSTFIILLTATFPTLAVLAFFFSLGAYFRIPKTDPQTTQCIENLRRAVFLLIDMVEQERTRSRSLENALETASSVPLPLSPSEQQVNSTAHERPQRLLAVADRHRDRLSADNSPENIATPEDTFFARVEEARQQLLRRRNPNGYSTVRAAPLRTSSLLDGDTRAPLTNGYTSSSSLTNGDTHTTLTNRYHHPTPIINGEAHTTTNRQSTIISNVSPAPSHPLTTTTRIQINELVGVLVQVLREAEPRPSEAQIQNIISEYMGQLRELRESNRRQIEDLSEGVNGLNTHDPTVNGNSGAVNGFHIDAGIVRNENAVNGTTVNGIIPNRTTPTHGNATGQPSFLRPREVVNDTDLDELRAFRNGRNLTNGDTLPRSEYHITPPGTPSLSTRSNSLSGTTLVNSILSLSGSTLVNSSVDGDTPPPSTYGDQDFGIEVYRNDAYETTMVALRRRRAMSDMRRAARTEEAGRAGIPIDEHARRGAVAIGWIGLRERNLRPYPNSASEEEEDEEEEEESETLGKAEESWWGLRDGRAPRRRDSVEEEMMAHLLGRDRREIGDERVDRVANIDEPRVNGVGEHGTDADDEAEHEAGDERGSDERFGRE